LGKSGRRIVTVRARLSNQPRMLRVEQLNSNIHTPWTTHEILWSKMKMAAEVAAAQSENLDVLGFRD
jgi:hypothetical protein